MQKEENIILKIGRVIITILVFVVYPGNLIHLLSKKNRQELFGKSDEIDPRIARGEIRQSDIDKQEKYIDLERLLLNTKNIHDVNSLDINGYFIFQHKNKRITFVLFKKYEIYFITNIESLERRIKNILFIYGKRSPLYGSTEVYKKMNIDDFVNSYREIIKYSGPQFEHNMDLIAEIESSQLFQECVALYMRSNKEERLLPRLSYKIRYRSYQTITVKTKESKHNIITGELFYLHQFLNAFETVLGYLINQDLIENQLYYYNKRNSTLTNIPGRFELIYEVDNNGSNKYLLKFFDPEIYDKSNEFDKLYTQRNIVKTYKYKVNDDGWIDIEKFCRKITGFSETSDTKIFELIYKNREFFTFDWETNDEKSADIRRSQKIIDLIEKNSV